MQRSFPLLAAVGLLACRPATPTGDAPITPAAIETHTKVLADDSLQGRGTGEPGYQKAADYVAAEFKKYGLEPGGPDGSYFQPVHLRETWLVPGSASVSITGPRPKTLVFGDDFVTVGDVRDSTTAVEGQIVFVGYGVSAPELQYDDYAGIDVKGKVVAAIFGAPSTFPPNPRAHYGGGVKDNTAAERGAIGMITLWTEDGEKMMPWSFLQRITRRSSMAWLDAPGGTPSDAPAIPSGGILSPKASAALFEGSGTTWAAVLEAARQGKPQSRALKAGIKIRKASTLRAVTTPNVIARLPGSDPALAGEYVVFTAHLDHDGIGETIAGDSIYNGAIDNAAGVAALLEIARAFAALPTKPKRSLIFIATAAEEHGLLGAASYAANPTVPIGSIVANLNMDGNHMLFPTKSIIALGAEHSTLGEDAAAAAAATNLELETELMPEQAFFTRSDHYPFVKKGVPALFFVNGSRSTDSTVNGMAVLGTWLGTIYHTPKDDLNQPMHYQSGARYAEVVFRIGRRVADAPERPRFKPGDFFGTKFGR